MNQGSQEDSVAWFEAYRPELRALAYRMLSTISDAEDVMQDAYFRVRSLEEEAIEHPRAYLRSLVTRLCLDHLKSARVTRETYVGPWLPEPLVEGAGGLHFNQFSRLKSVGTRPDELASIKEDISVALLLALERLSPLERAAFLLRDVFDVDYEEIATALGRSEESCRQLAARGRKSIREKRPRFTPTQADTRRLLTAFQNAVATGDVEGLEQFLSDDVVYSGDGGGRVSAATKPLIGRRNVARFILGIAKRFPSFGLHQAKIVTINGSPGLVFEIDKAIEQTIALDWSGEQLSAFYAVRNPEKLRHLHEPAEQPRTGEPYEQP